MIACQNGRTELAPFYNLVSTTVFSELEARVSMRMGKEYQIDGIDENTSSSMSIMWNSAASLPELAGYEGLIEKIRVCMDARAELVTRL